MEIVNKNNISISNDDIKNMFEIYYGNLPETKKNNMQITKEEMAKELVQSNNLLCSMFYDNGKLIGYIIMYLREDENFIREFEIVKEYQHDGKTFINMIKMALPYTDIRKKYTGIIYNDNYNAKMAFKRVGALIKDKKYVCTYDNLIKCLNVESDFFKKDR